MHICMICTLLIFVQAFNMVKFLLHTHIKNTFLCLWCETRLLITTCLYLIVDFMNYQFPNSMQRGPLTPRRDYVSLPHRRVSFNTLVRSVNVFLHVREQMVWCSGQGLGGSQRRAGWHRFITWLYHLIEAREFQKNNYFCFIDYAKAFDSVGHNKLWKILKEMGIPDHPTCLLRNLYAGQEATLEPDMEQQTGSKQEKEYVKAVYCYPAYLTYTS